MKIKYECNKCKADDAHIDCDNCKKIFCDDCFETHMILFWGNMNGMTYCIECIKKELSKLGYTMMKELKDINLSFNTTEDLIKDRLNEYLQNWEQYVDINDMSNSITRLLMETTAYDKQ